MKAKQAESIMAIKTLRTNPGIVAIMSARSMAKMGVREDSGSNRGRWVDAIIEMAGGDDSDAPAWCAYFCWAMWYQACIALGLELDCKTSGGVLRSWHDNPNHQIRVEDVRSGRMTLEEGDIMIRVRDDAHTRAAKDGGIFYGHAELVVAQKGEWIHTIGGNTNNGDSAEGDGVFEKPQGIRLSDKRLVGFLRPTAKEQPLF
jgi:hypothetical protein